MTNTLAPSSADLRPGLVAAAAATVVAVAANRFVPAVSALTVAVLLGICLGGRLPASTGDGLAWGAKRLLRLGVVLLGLQLDVSQAFGLGLAVLAAVVCTVATTFTGTLFLARRLGVDSGLGLMVATGFSICGASAITAMDSVGRARRDEVATAIALVTLYGTGAIAFIPLIGGRLGMEPQALGTWAGLSVHEVAQVVAAASPAGAAAVSIAVVVKLTRVVLLAPIVAGVSMTARQVAATAGGPLPPAVPLFVLGFLAAIAVRSLDLLPAQALAGTRLTTTLLFAAALFALGTTVRLGALLRIGRRGLALGALSTLLISGVGLGAVALIGGM